jgi:hypothetical protein
MMTELMSELGRLWRGELSFARALWGYAVIFGLAINLLMSGLALAAYALTGSVVLLAALHLGALPYNILACVGAWRSAASMSASESQIVVARLAVIGLFAGLVFL